MCVVLFSEGLGLVSEVAAHINESMKEGVGSQRNNNPILFRVGRVYNEPTQEVLN